MKLSADTAFKSVAWSGAFLGVAIGAAILVQMTGESLPVWRHEGWRFLISSEWDPAAESFGAAAAAAGTLAAAAIALVIAVPLAFAAAVFVNSLPKAAGACLGHAMDLLAAIPSVIYGMWGLFVLCPLVQRLLEAFGVETTGLGLASSAIVLALMALPYISAIMRNVLALTPVTLVEAAAGIGCTRWEATWNIVRVHARRGLVGAVLIGLGRALGETMAVLFVCGGVSELPKGLFDCCTTIAATIANDFGEASGLHRTALFALGAILLAIELAVQFAAVKLIGSGKDKSK